MFCFRTKWLVFVILRGFCPEESFCLQGRQSIHTTLENWLYFLLRSMKSSMRKNKRLWEHMADRKEA